MKDLITIRVVSTAEELEQAQEIRVTVFEEEQGFPHEVNIDGADQAASHVLILEGKVPVATARLELDDWTGYRFTDLFTLLKIDGQWKIMSKVFHLHS